MSPEKIKTLVDRGIEIVAQIKLLQEELKKIEEQLKAAGLDGKHQELKDSDREGRRFSARGSRSIVPVVFTADSLVKSFAKDSATHQRIAKAAGDKFDSFFEFKPTFETKYKDGKAFRAAADEQLGEAAPAFVTACLATGKGGIPKSAVKVEWEEGLSTLGKAEATKEEAV